MPHSMTRIRRIGYGALAGLAIAAMAGQAGAVEAAKPGQRFEVTGIKAVRPTLVATIAALQTPRCPRQGSLPGLRLRVERH